MKVCSRCKVEKDFSEFHKDCTKKDRLQSRCKDCEKEYQQNNKEKIAEGQRKWRENNKEIIAEKAKKYRENNREKIVERETKYRENNREKIAEGQRKFYQANKEKRAEYYKKYRENNKEKEVERHRKYRENNREKIAEGQRKYRENNKEKVREQTRKYEQNNKEKIAERKKKYNQINKERIVKRQKIWQEKNPYLIQAYSLIHARNRSKKKNIPIDLDFISKPNIMEWLKRQPRCECCNVEFDIGSKNGKGKPPNSPSLDRFYPEKGYVKGNVFLICVRCNTLKYDATVKELETVVAWMKQNNI